MTFEEYADKYLGKHGFKDVDLTLIRMGWNARGSHGNCQGILDGSDHIADDSKMVKGNVALAGDITDQDGTTFYRSLLVQFTDDSSLRAAVDSGQCRFAVFGGEV